MFDWLGLKISVFFTCLPENTMVSCDSSDKVIHLAKMFPFAYLFS